MMVALKESFRLDKEIWKLSPHTTHTDLTSAYYRVKEEAQ